MTSAQFQGLAREILFAIAALLVSFNLFPESNVDIVGAAILALAVLVWGIAVKPTDGAGLGSGIRKVIQSVAPVLVLYSLVSPEQAATISALALSIVGTWSVVANKPSN
jgi:hypothetical protein